MIRPPQMLTAVSVVGPWLRVSEAPSPLALCPALYTHLWFSNATVGTRRPFCVADLEVCGRAPERAGRSRVRVRFCAVKNRAVSNRNCVVARRGGAQRNENDPSITPAARRGGRRELDSAGAGVRFGGRGKLPTLVPTPIGSCKMRVKCGLCRRTPRHQHPRSGQGSWARARSARRRSGSAVVATGFSDVVGFHPMVKSEQVSDVA